MTDKEVAIMVLNELSLEADLLLSQNDGLHNMHGHRAAIWTAKSCIEDDILEPNDLELMSTVDYLIRNMRIANKIKKIPKPKLKRRKLFSWVEVGE